MNLQNLDFNSVNWVRKKPNKPLIKPPSLISYRTSCPLGRETASWLGYQVSNRIRALSSPSTKSRGSESTVGIPAWMHSACCPRKGDTDFDASGKVRGRKHVLCAFQIGLPFEVRTLLTPHAPHTWLGKHGRSQSTMQGSSESIPDYFNLNIDNNPLLKK